MLPAVCLLLSALASRGWSEKTGPLQLQAKTAEATPLQDDAALHDIQFVGNRVGWVVGDRGTVWRTTDGGRTWRFVPTPVDCTLTSAWFLTDQVGWVVGGGTTPYTQQSYGVVLATTDGGRTWQQPTKVLLPRLEYVRFFDLKHGVAAGEASPAFPTGILTTNDGGRTWQPLPGKRQAVWKTACFLSPDIGALAGRQGKATLVGGGRLLQPRLDDQGLRGLWDVQLRPDEGGWLVGDGGLVLRTETGGVVWQLPEGDLPQGTTDFFDFRAVASHGRKAWIAGRPGSVVWHTPDSGRTWVRQRTGQTAPINALWFTDEKTGFAAGDLGTLLKTEDGGQSWRPVRGSNRRAALLAIWARPKRASMNLLAQYAGELGYRSIVLLPARRDIGPGGYGARHLKARLRDGVLEVGGSSAEIDWRFPIVLPGLERDRDKLIADWNRRTEGRLSEIFLGNLVARLRTWRPSVVVIDRTAPDDAVTRLLNEALLKAVEQASDPTRFIQHRELGGLEPWSVGKVYERLPADSTGQVHIDPHRYLPRLKATVQSAAAPAFGMFASVPRQTAGREAYRLVVDGQANNQPKAAHRDLFSGIALAAGSEARRRLVPLREQDYEQRLKTAQKQRNFQAYAERYLDDDRHAAQLVAQLKPITKGLAADQAALQLSQLAAEYRRRSEWDLDEATLVEMVEQYPDEPVSHLAMVRLLRLWSGTEPVWQRARAVGVNRGRFTLDVESVRRRVEKAEYLAKTTPDGRDVSEQQLGPDPVQLASDPGTLRIDRRKGWRSGAVENWLEQAVRIASLLRLKNPALYQSPGVQFSVASLLRKRGKQHLSDRFYRRFQTSGSGEPWKLAADTETWLLRPAGLPPKPMVTCRRADRPPQLDGVLSDACWQDAEEIRLTRSAETEVDLRRYAFALIAYDQEFLYLAASIPRHPDAPNDGPQHAGRTHDADLRAFDRISLFLDVDRDYATWYTLEADQRGWTSEGCFGDRGWDPKWFVAADGDAEHWRIEAAVPFEELVPVAPRTNVVWAAGLVRTIPAVAVETWTHPAAVRPQPETFGLIRFE